MGFMTAMLIMGAAGLGLQATGSIAGGRAAGKASEAAGRAARRAAEAQASLAEYNAAVADVQAKDAVARGAIEEQQFRRDLEVLVGAQRAGYAAGNIDVGYGSAVDVQADAAFLGELDALTLRTNAAREAWGYQVEAVDLRQRAALARREGIQLQEAGYAEARGLRRSGYLGGTAIAGGGSELLRARYGFGQGTRAVLPSARVPGAASTYNFTPRAG